MKKTSLILLFILIIPLASALMETHVFFIGDSFETSGKNVTLIAIGEDSDEEDVLVVCINNQEIIISDEDNINGLEFTFEDIQSNYAELKIKFPSSGECDASCSNELCFSEEIPLEDSENDTVLLDPECTSNLGCNDGDVCTTDSCLEDKCSYETIQDCGYIIGEEKDNSDLMTFSSILLILVVVLIIILIFKKFKKKR